MRCSGIYESKYNNSNVWERSLLSILVHHVELLDTTIVKNEYFTERVHSEIFDILMETCKEGFDPTAFIKRGFTDIDYLYEYIYDFFMFEESYKMQFIWYEKLIVDNYKRYYQADLNSKLSIGNITYEDFTKEMQYLDSIRQVSLEPTLNKKIIEDILTKEQKNVSLGRFGKLEKILMLETDDLVTVAAPPNFGKTPFLLNIFNELLNNEHNHCQYYNLEVNKDIIVRRLIAIDSKEKMVDLNVENERVIKSMDKYDKDNFYMCDNPMTLEKMIIEITSHLKEDKQNIVFIDHIGLVSSEDKQLNRSNYERVTYIMKQLRIVCKKYNALLFIASQCDRESLRNGKLTMHSLKDSGEIENSSTHVILLYEDKEREKTFNYIKNITVDIAKNRNNYTYRLPMEFVGSKQLFYESKD